MPKIDKNNLNNSDRLVQKEIKNALEDADEMQKLLLKALENHTSFILLLNKVEIVCSEDVYRKAEAISTYIWENKDKKLDKMSLATKLRELTIAMRKDLGGKDIDWLEEKRTM